MSKHSKAGRARRSEQNAAVERIQAAWQASVPPARAKEFEKAVEAARARGPEPRRPDMPKGTAPNPPRPGREPKPKKDPMRSKKRY